MRLRNALKIAVDYIKNPYCLLTPTIYSEHAHNHICFARRLMGSRFTDVCPYHNAIGFCGPERSDCCDWCKYFGVIDFCKDENNNNSIKLYMNKSIVGTFEEKQHGN